MIKEAVALGQGISILPARTMQAEIEQGRLVAVKLNAPGLARPVGIVHRRRKKFNRATERLLAMLSVAGVGRDRQLTAIYTYLAAVPCLEGGPGEPANRCH